MVGSRAYYNENDPYCCVHLSNLMDIGLITPGKIDDRSIHDVSPDDVTGFRRVHWFAGLGGWDYALNLAAWGDHPVWTGSCPCQPFSVAGSRCGISDERHLWPTWLKIIKKSRPETIFGEQVASSEVIGSELEASFVIAVQAGDYARANKLAKRLVQSKGFHFHKRWLDAVHSDMEAEGYAFRFKILGAHSVGAPHIRQRLYFAAQRLADAHRGECIRLADGEECERDRAPAGWQQGNGEPSAGGELRGMADARGGERDWREGEQRSALSDTPKRDKEITQPGRGGSTRGLADTQIGGWREERADAGWLAAGDRAEGRAAGSLDVRGAGGMADSDGWDTRSEGLQRGWEHGREPQDSVPLRGEYQGQWGDTGPALDRPDPLDGFWRDADWLYCRDGKWRPVEARTLALVDGLSDSLGLVLPDADAARKEIDDWCRETDAGPGEAMHDLWVSLVEESKCVRSIGGHDRVPSATVLLAFMRKLSEQGWPFQEGILCASEETQEGCVRSVRREEQASCSPFERGLDKQRSRQSPDALRVLSSILARNAQKAWPDAISADAEIGFPLGSDAKARVGRLRAYGNAICPQTAAAFIRATIDQ